MTRINAATQVRLLTDEHLLAEHREIKRIPFLYKKRKEAGIEITKGAPKEFTLGVGHILFFLDKPAYTLARYCGLYNECINRGFSVENYKDNWSIYADEYFGKDMYIPTEKSNQIIIDRITERLLGSLKEHWHYYGAKLTKEEAIKLLNTPKNQVIIIQQNIK